MAVQSHRVQGATGATTKAGKARRFAGRLGLELEAIEPLEIAGHARAGKVNCAVRAGRAPELTAVAKPSLLCRTWPTTTNPIRIHWDCTVWLGWWDSSACRCRTTGSRQKSSRSIRPSIVFSGGLIFLQWILRFGNCVADRCCGIARKNF